MRWLSCKAHHCRQWRPKTSPMDCNLVCMAISRDVGRLKSAIVTIKMAMTESIIDHLRWQWRSPLATLKIRHYNVICIVIIAILVWNLWEKGNNLYSILNIVSKHDTRYAKSKYKIRGLGDMIRKTVAIRRSRHSHSHNHNIFVTVYENKHALQIRY